MNEPKLSTEQLAHVIDVTPRRVQQMHRAGQLTADDQGNFPLVQSVRAYVRLLRQTKSDELLAKRLEKLDVEIALGQIDLEERRGELVDRQQVMELGAAVIRAVRDKILACVALPEEVREELCRDIAGLGDVAERAAKASRKK